MGLATIHPLLGHETIQNNCGVLEPDERVRMLCAQLLRMTNVEIIQFVGDESAARTSWAVSTYASRAAFKDQRFATLTWLGEKRHGLNAGGDLRAK
jgi:hypothetical protein